MQIFISVFLIPIQNWKQRKCPSAGKWANNSSIYNPLVFFTAKKKNKKTINTCTNTQESQMMWKLSWGGADETQCWKV